MVHLIFFLPELMVFIGGLSLLSCHGDSSLVSRISTWNMMTSSHTVGEMVFKDGLWCQMWMSSFTFRWPSTDFWSWFGAHRQLMSVSSVPSVSSSGSLLFHTCRVSHSCCVCVHVCCCVGFFLKMYSPNYFLFRIAYSQNMSGWYSISSKMYTLINIHITFT